MIVFAFFVSSSLMMTVADAVPAFDVKQGCGGTEVAAAFPPRSPERCVQSEEAARDQLKKSWLELPVADKTECVSTVKIGGPPSYVELLTCIEMKRDAREIRATSHETVGSAHRQKE
jgi:hypothetical protein